MLACPTAARAQSITVTLLPGSVGFTLTSGSSSNPGTLPLAATTTWIALVPGRTISLYGYFSSATAALAHTNPTNTYNIPSSRVEVSVNGGANAPFDQTVAFGAANAGRLLFSQVVTLATATGNRTDTALLNINLSSFAIAADTYTGTLRVRAQVSP